MTHRSCPFKTRKWNSSRLRHRGNWRFVTRENLHDDSTVCLVLLFFAKDSARRARFHPTVFLGFNFWSYFPSFDPGILLLGLRYYPSIGIAWGEWVAFSLEKMISVWMSQLTIRMVIPSESLFQDLMSVFIFSSSGLIFPLENHGSSGQARLQRHRWGWAQLSAHPDLEGEPFIADAVGNRTERAMPYYRINLPLPFFGKILWKNTWLEVGHD